MDGRASGLKSQVALKDVLRRNEDAILLSSDTDRAIELRESGIEATKRTADDADILVPELGEMAECEFGSGGVVGEDAGGTGGMGLVPDDDDGVAATQGDAAERCVCRPDADEFRRRAVANGSGEAGVFRPVFLPFGEKCDDDPVMVVGTEERAGDARCERIGEAAGEFVGDEEAGVPGFWIHADFRPEVVRHIAEVTANLEDPIASFVAHPNSVVAIIEQGRDGAL